MDEQEGYDWSLLEDAVEYEFTGWRPEEGDVLVGTVAYVTEGESTAGGRLRTYPMVAIITREGEGVMVHAFHQILANEIERQQPQTGDPIAIKRRGDKPNPKGSEPMKVYTLVLDTTRRAARAPALVGSPETPALPAEAVDANGDFIDQEDDPLSRAEATQEPLGWEPTGTTDADGAGVESPLVEVPSPAPEPISRASKPQRDAIDTLRAKQGLIPINWHSANVSMERAAAHIRELQG